MWWMNRRAVRSRRATGGGIIYPAPTLNAANLIGDTSTANPGNTITGTNWTRTDSSALVTRLLVGTSEATITAVTRDGGGAGTDSLTFTSPSLAIGSYPITVVTLGGQATIEGTANVSGYDAFSPWSEAGCLDTLLGGVGETIDGDNKVVSIDGKKGARFTMAVRPLAASASAAYGGRKVWDLAGACRGSGPISVSEPALYVVVGHTTSAGAFSGLVSNNVSNSRWIYTYTPASKWTFFDGSSSVYVDRSVQTPTIFGLVFNGASSKAYTQAKTPTTHSPGTTAASTSLNLGSTNAGGSNPWNGIVASLNITTTVTNANAVELMRYYSWYYGLTLGA